MRRTALVTGGTRGIGLAIVENLSKDHNVAVVWQSTPPESLSDEVLHLELDLTQSGSCKTAIENVITKFSRLDVIVNNAGVAASTPKDAFNHEDHQKIMDVNLFVPSQLLSHALPHLKRGASIINISSVNAVLPPRTAAIFGASKAALNLWTRAMAKELGEEGIRVNAVAPGAIDISDKPRSPELRELFLKDTALGRLGKPEDVASVVRFLAGEDAGFVTGEILSVSGGYRL